MCKCVCVCVSVFICTLVHIPYLQLFYVIYSTCIHYTYTHTHTSAVHSPRGVHRYDFMYTRYNNEKTTSI